MDTLMQWLPANMPVDDGMVSLIHGDYRLDNIIFHADECKAVALLDWELSTLAILMRIWLINACSYGLIATMQ